MLVVYAILLAIFALLARGQVPNAWLLVVAAGASLATTFGGLAIYQATRHWR